MSRFSPIKKTGAAETTDGPEQPETEQRPRSRKSRHSPPVTRNRLSVSVVTLVENEARNGLQLHFPGKPDEAVRAEIKAAGWRWSFFNGCWYHRNTPENKTFAEQFVTRQLVANAQSLAPVPPESKPEQPVENPSPSRGSTPVIPLWRRSMIRA